MSEGLYVYGLAGPEAATALAAVLPGLVALGGAAGAVEASAFGCAVAIVSPYAGGEVPQTRRNMLAHTRALEAVMPVATVLPMRFGVVADGAEALGAALAPRAAEIALLLRRFAGLAEYGVRVTWDREPAMRALIAGSPDLRARHEALRGAGPAGYYAKIELGRAVAEALDRRRQAAEKRMLAALRPCAADTVLRAPEEDVETLRADFLIRATEESEFLAAVERACAESDFAPGASPRIRCVGPAPIYNFVSLSLAPEPASDDAQRRALAS